MRLIDADTFVKSVVKSGFGVEFINKVTALLIEAPTIDIVRCKECKFWEGEERNGFYYFETCSRTKLDALYDDFCSYGEVRDE